MNWSTYYPTYIPQKGHEELGEGHVNSSVSPTSKQVEVADIGCGFGGLLFALAPKMPETLILGMDMKVLAGILV